MREFCIDHLESKTGDLLYVKITFDKMVEILGEDKLTFKRTKNKRWMATLRMGNDWVVMREDLTDAVFELFKGIF